jgi:hypothetical protein
MKRRARILSAALAASVLGATLASPVAACLSGYSPAEHFQRADVVVTGVAVDRHVGNAVEAVLVLLGNESPSDVPMTSRSTGSRRATATSASGTA